MRTATLALAAVLTLSACGMDAGSSATTTTAPPTTTVPPTTTMGENLLKLDVAKRDLAEHLGIDVDDIEVVSQELVTWSDGSIGCPEPGMFYTQAMVDGYLIILSVDGTEYRYHGGGDNDPFRCDRDPLNPIRG